MQIRFAYLWLFWLGIVPMGGQELAVSTQRLSLRMLEGGPRPPVARLSITSPTPWTAVLSGEEVLALSPTAGAGTGMITATAVSWQKPGTHQATITISNNQKISRVISVTLVVEPRQAPKFSYVAGPSGCSDAPGLPIANAAVCVVPGENPPGNFSPPALGQSYTDPNFGARVHVIAGPSALHGYSTPSPVSAANKYALVSIDNESTVVELLTGKVIKKVSINFEGAMWDGRNERFLYTFADGAVRRFDVTSGKATTVVNYRAGAQRFQSITAGGTGEMTKDNWLSFHAPQEHQVCALDATTPKTYCARLPEDAKVDFTNISKGVDRISGHRYVLVIQNGPFLLYTVNQSAGRLDLAGRGPENILMDGGDGDGVCEEEEACIAGVHSDTMEDSAGNQFLVTGIEEQAPCGYSLYSIQLNKGAQMGIPAEFGGGLKRTMPLFRCGGKDTWADFHAACAKAAPSCVFSITTQAYNRTRNPNDKTPVKHTPYLGEIIVMRENGAEIRRLAMHRSLQFSNEEANGYWSTPRAAISPDGAYVVATSNFGFPNQRRVIVVETGHLSEGAGSISPLKP